MKDVTVTLTCAGCGARQDAKMCGSAHAKASPAGQRHIRREVVRIATALGWRGDPARCAACANALKVTRVRA